MNQQYETQGKLGLALIKHSSNEGSTKILLYRRKEEILSTVLLQSTTKIHLKGKYLQYHDDDGAFWSLYFADENELHALLNELRDKCDIASHNESTNADESHGSSSKTANIELTSVDDTSTHEKGDLKSRIAKVGHQLPKLNVDRFSAGLCDEADSPIPSDFETISTSHESVKYQNSSSQSKPHEFSKHPPLLPKPTANKDSDFVHVAVQPSTFFSNVMLPQNAAAAAMTLNNLSSEMRVQSTENRMTMSKLEMKIDRVLDKIELLKLNSGKSLERLDDRDEEILKLEEKIVELKKENRVLKLQITDWENAKQSNATVDVQSNESSRLKEELEQKIEAIGKLQSEIAANVVKTTEFQNKIKDLENKFREEQNKMGELETKNKNCDVLSVRVKELETKLAEEQAKSKEIETNAAKKPLISPQPPPNDQLIRGIMNGFFQKLMKAVNEKPSFTSQEILKITAELVRSETMAALKRN